MISEMQISSKTQKYANIFSCYLRCNCFSSVILDYISAMLCIFVVVNVSMVNMALVSVALVLLVEA